MNKQKSGGCEWQESCKCTSIKPISCRDCFYYWFIDSGYGFCRALPSHVVMAWCRDICSLYKERDAEFTEEKIDFGISVHEAAIAQANAECQARVEGIFRWLDSYLDCPIRGLDNILKYQYHIPKDELKAIKKQEEVE